MTNSYFNHTSPIARFTTSDAVRLNNILNAVEAGFDKLPSVNEINQGSRNFSIATGTANTYSITVPFQISSYVAGLNVRVLIMIANTGSSTLNVNGIGQATIKRADGTNLLPADLRASSLNEFTFDGTAFRLTSFHGASEASTSASATAASASASSAATSAGQAAASQVAAAASAVAAQASSATATVTIAGARFGLRNILINPVFWLSQWLGTGSSAFLGTYAANVYVRDRWKAGPTGLTFTIANSAMTITAGSVRQIVAGRNIHITGPYTLSWVGTSTAQINGVTVANGGSVELPKYTDATVTFGLGTFSFPQLEFGSVKTPFEYRHTDIDRAMCQQYYQKSYLEGVAPGTITDVGIARLLAANVSYFYTQFLSLSAPMIAVPVIRLYSPVTGIVGRIWNETNNWDVLGVAWNVSEKVFQAVNEQGDLTTNGFHSFHWTADAER